MAALTANLDHDTPVTAQFTTDGHVTYNVTWQVQTTDKWDGPAIVSFAPGLPLFGAPYSGINGLNDVDATAYYRGGMSINPASANVRTSAGTGRLWKVTAPFSSKPAERCNEQRFDNPLTEPPKWSGGSNGYTKQADKDNQGNAIQNSSWQQHRGPKVEVKDGKSTFTLDMNVLWLNLDFLGDYKNAVNDGVWWGKPARTLQCSDFTWQRLMYGMCNWYYAVHFEFEHDPETFDLKLIDEGSRIWIGGAGANRADADNYKPAKLRTEDRDTVLLDGAGGVLGANAQPVIQEFRYYPEKDFSAVGWPATAPI